MEGIALESTAKTCQYCGKPLVVSTPPILENTSIVLYEPCDCPEAVEARKQAEDERRAEERKDKIRARDARYDRAGIPKEHRRFDHPLSANIAEGVKNGAGYYIVGKCGRRKTTLACAAARRLMASDSPWSRVQFLPCVDIPGMIRSTYRRGSDITEDDLARKYSTCNLLILDDLGKGKITDFAIELIFRIIDWRTRELLPMIITSQYERDELAQKLIGAGIDTETAESLASRLCGHCERIRLEGEDFRLARGSHE